MQLHFLSLFVESRGETRNHDYQFIARSIERFRVFFVLLTF